MEKIDPTGQQSFDDLIGLENFKKWLNNIKSLGEFPNIFLLGLPGDRIPQYLSSKNFHR